MIQNAPLMTKGMAAVGIRIDGCGNDVTVSRGVNVQADGPNGNGILAAFGKDHRITLAKGSKVTADGEGGIGAAFDFGQNSLGNEFGSRASYAARFFSQYVYGFEDMLDPDLLETDGPLVDDFTVRGELSGKKAKHPHRHGGQTVRRHRIAMGLRRRQDHDGHQRGDTTRSCHETSV